MNNHLARVQIIVITCSETRKHIIKQQLDNLRISIPYVFFQGYTPATSESYIVDKDPKYPEKDTMICCMRSHAAAIQQFVVEFPEKDYLLVLEDDAALLKGFEKELEQIMDIWSKHDDEIDHISLGYFPKSSVHLSEKKFKNLYWNLQHNVWGTQAYIVKRSVAKQMAEVLHRLTTKDVRKAFDDHILTNLKGKSCANKIALVQPDVLLSVGWRQAIVFPLMVIELPIKSTINPSSNARELGRWDPVFSTGGRKIDEFYELPAPKEELTRN
jgi:GR25 family glycosyltransferase involved in LPS biosynthesis